MSYRFTVHDPEGKELYPVVIEQSFDRLASELGLLGIEGRKICIVTDSNVAPLYLEKIQSLFASVLYPSLDPQEVMDQGRVISFVFPAGENSKNLDVVSDVYEKLILAKFDRKDVLVALGGGVVGDLTGFTAATYLRGIRFIQIPTTLLSQVDSSVGGKTGVDFRSYKNMVGAFYMPILVYMNASVLKSMPERDFLSGMGEVVKYGLIRKKDFYEELMENREKILSREEAYLERVIYISADCKREVVEEDPTEKGIRGILNLGHTCGHAIERLMNFELLHGECVSIGTVVAARISEARGYLSSEEADLIKACFESLKLPVDVPERLSSAEILEVSKNDKKMDQGKIKFILLSSVGEAYIDPTVTDEEILTALDACR
ncbi:MAG: 3-dehydroquinate synthase [Lachnospiraceae bacterium]|nr:3-dehydroquinate synthase [Lachnospiraceae bacterium]